MTASVGHTLPECAHFWIFLNVAASAAASDAAVGAASDARPAGERAASAACDADVPSDRLRWERGGVGEEPLRDCGGRCDNRTHEAREEASIRNDDTQGASRQPPRTRKTQAGRKEQAIVSSPLLLRKSCGGRKPLDVPHHPIRRPQGNRVSVQLLAPPTGTHAKAPHPTTYTTASSPEGFW